jgi:hypothetical protein
MSNSRTNLGLILGVVLIGAGVLILVGELTGLATFDLLWPLIIVGVGLAFFLGMVAGGTETGALAVPGSILVMIGLILFAQNALNAWETWSYCWALIIVAVGIGLWIWGAYTKRADLRADGLRTIHVGVVLFVVFGLILTLVFNFLGMMTGGISLWGLLLALVGAYLLIQRSVRLLQHRAHWDDRDLFWPVIMIGVGLVLFLFGLGQLPLVELTGLWRWWPLLLVMIGIDWLIGRRWPVVGALAATLIVILSLLLMFDPSLLRVLAP